MEKSKKAVRAVPEGFHTVTPYLVVDNATKFMEFIQKAFNGKITYVMKQPDDQKVMHATVQIGDSTIMLSDAMEGHPAQTAILYLYVNNADELFDKATQAKATVVQKMEDQFYGDHVGAVKDEWGNVWWIGKHVEDVEEKELERRAKIVQKERKEKAHA
ncbi:MAG: VOC family protein [Bacteroidota bacterium]